MGGVPGGPSRFESMLDSAAPNHRVDVAAAQAAGSGDKHARLAQGARS